MTKQIRYACFSDAIREGAKLRAQTFGCLIGDDGFCALGAGLVAMGFGAEARGCLSGEHFITPQYPYMESESDCPAQECREQHGNLITTIMFLNDSHRWSREAIADWLNVEEEKLGFITLTEEAEALNPTMISEYETVKATV